MEKLAEQFTQLKELLIEYFDSNVEYYKFAGFEKLIRLVVAMTFIAVVFVLLILALLLFGFALAIWLGNLLENEPVGYLCVAFFYLLLLLLVYLLKKPLIERPLIKIFYQLLYKEEERKSK